MLAIFTATESIDVKKKMDHINVFAYLFNNYLRAQHRNHLKPKNED